MGAISQNIKEEEDMAPNIVKPKHLYSASFQQLRFFDRLNARKRTICLVSLDISLHF